MYNSTLKVFEKYFAKSTCTVLNKAYNVLHREGGNGSTSEIKENNMKAQATLNSTIKANKINRLYLGLAVVLVIALSLNIG